MREPEVLAAALVIAISVIVATMHIAHKLGAQPQSIETEVDSPKLESKLADSDRTVPEAVSRSYVSPATLSQLQEAARLDDWRAIDAASAAAVAGR